MPNPKKKFSKARRSQRRAQYYNRLEAPAVGTCPNCGAPVQAHRACASCGEYRGRLIVKPAEAEA